MFTKKQIRALLWPLVLEQVLTGIMGVADTFMVSNVGEAAVSGVSLVDSINMLVVYFLSALATGGTIICSQYIGRGDKGEANHASNQVMASALALSGLFTLIFVTLRGPMLRLIFGTVEPSVMEAADAYFLITALSYPFLGLYSASAALHRATGDSRRPMLVAAAADVLNVIGNAVLIFVFHMGVQGAALATLASRIFSAAVMLWCQAKPGQIISLGGLASYRPDGAMLRRILRVGVPNAVENGMFQFGKLAVQSTVSVLGTTAIAAQAIVASLETCSIFPGMAIGIGLTTVVGQCMGAGLTDEARKYIKQFIRIAYCTTLLGVVVGLFLPIITRLTALTEDGRALVAQLYWFVIILRVIIWPWAFTLPNGLRAAGDVSYAMWVGTLSMWIFRVGLSWYLCRYTAVGLWGVWIGWVVDWLFRAICFIVRFRGHKWEQHHVLR